MRLIRPHLRRADGADQRFPERAAMHFEPQGVIEGWGIPHELRNEPKLF
jgi:hypothetical protein